MPLLKKFPLLMKSRTPCPIKGVLRDGTTKPHLCQIPILDTGKFEQWKFRIQQYLQNEHYALWEVIEFGDSYEAPQEVADTGSASEGFAKKKGRTVAVTTEDMQKRRNDVKARTTLLLALPEEHQLRFSKYKTAKELWAATLKTFGGNEATKKTKKNQLKQQYGNFKAEGKETLEQTFNRLQVIVSHLEFMDVEIEQDDMNQKFLTSLAPEWLMYTLVWRNRSDLNTMSLDDLYNHLKVYEPEVQKKPESNSQNMAFISSTKTSNGKEEVNTASFSTASTQVSPASANVAAASISYDTACAYIASQSNGSQVKYEDINQINEDDIEEIDIKWNMALLSMRADRFWKKTRKKITIQGTDVAGFDKLKVECFNCHKMGHFARECRAPRSQTRDWSYMANKEENHALIADEEASTKFALMSKSSSENKVFDNSLCSKACKKNTDSLNTKITELSEKLSDTKNTLYHYKLGLSQVEARLVEFKNQEIKLCKKIRGLEFKVESKDNRIERLTKDLEELKKEKEGLDSKLTGFQSASKDLDTLLGSQRPSPSIDSNSSDLQNNDFSVFEKGDSSKSIMSKPMIKFIKATDSLIEVKISKVETVRKPSVKYAKMYRNTTKSPKVRGNQRNWNNLKTQQLGKDFVMKNKACFKCGQFDYLAYDCGVWEEQGKTWPKNNNTHKSMLPKNVFYKTGRTPMRTNRPNMNDAQPKRTSFTKLSHSYARRTFQRTTAVRIQFRVPRVSTVNTKFPTVNKKFLTGNSKLSTAGLGNKGKAVKASACWIWRPKQNSTDKGPNSNRVSVIFKKYQYIDTQGKLKSDNGCSRHMTVNISYLSDYEPNDGWYVSFGQGCGKITGKGIIKTGKLEFENVYFMKDLKYNLFSVSQICDNKNSVLFNDSECIMLGRDFKLRDDTNVLITTPRQHNMYSIDLNNIVPHKDITCLVVKAFANESVLWHRRLGKFDAKRDEGYFIGYSLSSKEFRVFNKRTKRVEENLHVDFLENKLIEKGADPNWLFDIDTLTNSMNYVPVVVAGTTSINFSGTKDAATQLMKKDVSSLRYITLIIWFHEAHLESSASNAQDACNADAPESSGNSNPTATSTNPPANHMETLTVETPIPTVSLPVLTACLDDSPEPSSNKRLISKRVTSQDDTPSLDNILTLSNRFEDILRVTTNTGDTNGVEADLGNMENNISTSPTSTLRIHKDHLKSQIIGPVDTLNVWSLVDCPKRVRPIGTKWVLKNKTDERGIVIRNKARLVAQGHTHEEGIDYEEVFAPVARIEAIRLFLAYASFMRFTVYQMDVKSAFLYGIIDEEVYVMQHPGFYDPEFPARVYKVEKGDILKKFRYSDVRSANTPIDKENPWGEDGTSKDVDLHLYRSMIVSLMYLTASRPDIMFAVCACARHQVTPKECHMYAVKRFFRYLKGHPKLGLWYPKESPFDLVAYSDSDYGGATQDRKSTTGGCQFLSRRLISWQCKKQAIMATSTTEAEYVAAASGCGQVL
nr:ribonuclease H-like domain-containing protein [Tanacetum cinerariifolium]